MSHLYHTRDCEKSNRDPILSNRLVSNLKISHDGLFIFTVIEIFL